MGKFKVFVATNGQFYFNLCATNGRIIGTSETYKQKEGVFHGIKSVMTNCVKDKQFEVRRDVDNKPYFVLKAGNGEIILKSESYTSLGKCNVGINSVMKNGVTEIIEMPQSLADEIKKSKRIGIVGRGPNVGQRRKRSWDEPVKSNKVQRNAQCPCGSGKKFKQCCINKK